MDTLTHTVLGACTGQFIAGKQAGKKAMLIGALVNNLPDLDMFANFWHTPAEGLLSHRGITHSFFFLILSIPLLIALFRRMFKTIDLSWGKWFVLISHGLLLHILLDACTTYGTGWFEPFNHARVSFNTLFIIDPFFLSPLLLSALLLLILKKTNPHRDKIAVSALLLSGLYLLTTIGIKLTVDKTIRNELARQNLRYQDYSGIPTPLNNLLWYVLVKEKSDYKAGYYSILDKEKKLRFESINSNDYLLLSSYRQNRDVQHLLQFTKGYYHLEQKSRDTLCFSDLRFGFLSVDQLATAAPVFRFDIVSRNGDTLIQQSAFKKTSGAELRRLYQRIKGQ